MKKNILTFMTSNWKISKSRWQNDFDFLKNQNLFFDNYYLYDETMLGQDYTKFFKDHFSDHGFAYWSWKPYIIMKTLEKMNDNDILIYMDGGCTLPRNQINDFLTVLNVFVESLDNFDIGLIIRCNAKNECIIKSSILKHFKLYDNTYFREYYPHYAATIILLKKTELIKKLIFEWFMFFKDNYINLIKSDFYDKTNEDPCFYHNGGDQAILQCLLFNNKINVMNIAKMINPFNIITRIRK